MSASRHRAPGLGAAFPGGRAGDDTGCPILHVDMDAFYVGVAIRDRPDLADRPVIVGGATRGVVLSASYAARAHGVRSAMPITRARRLCPQALILLPDHRRFTAVSEAVMETFRSVTPLVEPISLDEAFLNVSGAARRLGSPAAVGEYLRARIRDEQRLASSVGVAATRQVAKVASRQAKPDGLLVVPPDAVTAFLHPLGVEELWGVGEVTAARLHQLGLHTVGDLAYVPLATLRRAVGPALGAGLHAMAWGGDAPAGGPSVMSRARPGEPDRSIGAAETFERDTDDPAVVRRELLRLSGRVATRLRAVDVVGRHVTLTVRFADFTTITRSRRLAAPTATARDVYAVAAALFAALGLQRARIRLVGVRVGGLGDARTTPRQLVLGARPDGWEAAERAVDRVSNRFGATIVGPAALIPTHKTSTKIGV